MEKMNATTGLKTVSKKTEYSATDLIILQKLEKAIQQKMYLDPAISLIGLAAKLGTNRTYLSDAIHLRYGISFSDFINKLRVEDAMRIMESENGDVLIKDLYQHLGYNSATSFFRNFKKQTGKSTGEWRREMLREKLSYLTHD